MECISRKQFLQRCALLGAAAVGGGSLLAGCGGGADSGESGQQTAAETETKSTAAGGDPCGDTSGLSETDLQMRKNLKYVARSPEEEKYCSNCKFYQADQYGEQCGGCQLFKGPVHPDGYCTSWFAMEQG